MTVVFHDSRPGDIPTWTIERTIRHIEGNLYEVEVREKTPVNPEGRIRCGVPSPFTLVDGVVRWVSNGAIPDMRTIRDDGINNLEGFVETLHVIAFNERLDALMGSYRRSQPARPSAEEMYEMRAAFGPGKEVVDVITGRRVRT